MSDGYSFTGFSQEAITFFEQLKQNNHKEWFDTHREIFDNELIAPAKQFVMAMGTNLQQSISKGITAIPKVNQSIFRIYRDTRFSHDKLPYKTHLGILFWEGSGKKLDNPGFYFHLEPPNLMLGAGMYLFSKTQLHKYRLAVADPELAFELEEALESVQKAGTYSIGGKHYKRIPAGFEGDDFQKEFLCYNGLYVGCEDRIPPEFSTPGLTDFCLSKFKDMSPLFFWLRDSLFG